MRCRLVDLSISLGGKQRLTIELDGDFRSEWDRLREKDCEVSVKKYQKKRSNDANAYAWLLIDRIARAKRITKTEVYRNAIREIGGVSDILTIRKSALKRFVETWSGNGIGWQVEEIGSRIPGWTNIVAYYGSSTYDTQQMSDLIDSLVQDAQSLDIETRPQEEINSLLEEYEKRC